MTDHVKTLSTRLNLLGGARTPLWNEYNWNAFTWGQGFDVIANPMHVLGNSLTPTEALSGKTVGKVVGDTLSPTSEAASMYLYDGNGYAYVFASNETNAGARDIPSYTSGTAASTTYTSLAAGSTTWS